MADFKAVIRKFWRPAVMPLVDDIRYKMDKQKFPYDGIHVYCGSQGSGKTASMVYHAMRVKQAYPRTLISSNLKLLNYEAITFGLTPKQQRLIDTMSDRQAKQMVRKTLVANLHNSLKVYENQSADNLDPNVNYYLLYEDAEQLSAILHYVRRGTKGHLIIVDEAHLFWNSTDSKDATIEVFAAVSQLRKNRTLIIASSQVAMRLLKAVREQMKSIIVCNTYFGIFTSQKVLDGFTAKYNQDTGKLEGDVLKRGFFFQSRKLRDSYDTYQVVLPSQQLYEQATS